MNKLPANKPFAESCEQNKWVILEVLKEVANREGLVLEVGSGTGQHAVFFSEQLPHLQWQPTDQASFLPGIRLWLEEANNSRILPLLELEVNTADWGSLSCDYLFSANTAHIMSQSDVDAFMKGAAQALKVGGEMLLYGPFNYNGAFTSDSNARFDQWLKSRDPDSGIKDFEHLNDLAQQQGLELLTDFEMPANNRILHWRKSLS